MKIKVKNSQSKLMKKKDYIILGLIILIYTIISFINLGSMKNPQTFYYFQENEAITVKLNSIDDVIRIKLYNGDISGEYALYTSIDNENFEYVKTVNGNGAFSWNEEKILKRAKYIKIVSITENANLGEMAFYNNAKDYIKINNISSTKNSNAKNLYDEEKMVPTEISYLNSTYFDEIYFARTAYNYKEHQQAYEWTHPPLGKLIQAIPLVIFNTMSPFFYRLMGNIAGIIMVAVIYIFAKSLFNKTFFATFAALLMSFDTFHFAQTRMGTIDSFLVLFIILSLYFMYQHISIKNDKYNLALSGLFFGLSGCIKWSGLLIGIPLAILYFIDIFKQKKNIIKAIINGIIFFVIIPILMYTGIYLLFPNNQVTYTNNFKDLINQTVEMFKYHSRLQADHPFSSRWYTWPISYKPVWYYTQDFSNNLRGTIAGIGNIIIWWTGIIATIYLLYKVIKHKNKDSFVLMITILSLWLPYIFIGRVMFLYHYFPVLPFIILAITNLFKDITTYLKTHIISIIYLVMAGLFFMLYYPIVSGMPVSNQYIESLKLLSSWYF